MKTPTKNQYFASLLFHTTVSKKMDHFDISFTCSLFSKSWEVTNYSFLGVAHLPVSRGSNLRPRIRRGSFASVLHVILSSVSLGAECCASKVVVPGCVVCGCGSSIKHCGDSVWKSVCTAPWVGARAEYDILGSDRKG